MRILDIIGMSFKSLWRRKVRTLLTVLGVVIGSCAIVVMISLGLGMDNAMKYYLTQFGDLNVITVYGNVWMEGQTEPIKITEENVEAMKMIEGVEGIFPKLAINSEMVSVCAGRGERYRRMYGEVYGVYPEYLEKFGYKFKEGEVPEIFSRDFIIFGEQSAYNFFDTKKKRNNTTYPQEQEDGTMSEPFFNPMEEQILLYVNNTNKFVEDNMWGHYESAGKSYEHKMTCVGILDAENSSGNWEAFDGLFVSMDFADELYDSYVKANKIKDAKEPEISELKIYVNDINNVATVQEQIEEMGFYCDSMESARQSMQGQLGSLEAMLGGLAAISLFVAAIGITNTMIMSIYERTREIGVMKVLGCKIKNIREMFLIEAACIGFVGGVAGILLSFIISFIFNKFGSSMLGLDYMYQLNDGTTLPISLIPFWLVIVALLFSTFVGIASGFYPANRAVKISALEAIKNE
ncbi:MAG: ABC transporter permease [Oscillospiraceae bacterium]|nr:ABC transporter permease [Oscillospiraceae bacterium]